MHAHMCKNYSKLLKMYNGSFRKMIARSPVVVKHTIWIWVCEKCAEMKSTHMNKMEK